MGGRLWGSFGSQEVRLVSLLLDLQALGLSIKEADDKGLVFV